jgi:hypothetical protein
MKIATVLRLLVVVAAIPSAAYAAGAHSAASLDAPAQAQAGSRVVIKWTGPGNSMDRIGVVLAGAPDATFPQGLPCYPAATHTATVRLPEQPGEYELRYLSFVGGRVLARRAITVLAAPAPVQAPATAVRGSKDSVVVKRGPTTVSARSVHPGRSPRVRAHRRAP